MKLRLFAVATLAAVTLVSPAAAQDPRGARAPMVLHSGPPTPDNGASACRGNRAFQCGVRAYDAYGPRQGLRWFQHGARRGSAPSMRAIGMILLRGDRDVPADPAAAMGWFYEAALRGDALSMYALSVGFAHGAGVPADPALSHFWLERAARAGNHEARQALRGLQ